MQIKELDKKHVEAKLYGNIGGFFNNGETFTALLEGFEAKGYNEVSFRMHCYGGSVLEGNVMYNALLNTKMKVNLIIDGVAASMAFFILPAVENVFIAENGFGMAHRASAPEFGDADSHLQTAKLLRDMEGSFIKRLSERTGMQADQIKSMWFDGRDHWLNADEMVKYGLAKGKLPATAKHIQVLDSEIVQGMTAEAMYNRFAAQLDNPNINSNSNKMKKELIEAYGLEGVTAESTDAEVLAKMKEKTASLEASAKAKETSAIKALLDNAKVPEGDLRKTYETIGATSGIEALTAILPKETAAPAVVQPIASLIKTDGAAGTAAVVQNWDWYQANAAADLEAMQVTNPTHFNALYKAKYGVEPA